METKTGTIVHSQLYMIKSGGMTESYQFMLKPYDAKNNCHPVFFEVWQGDNNCVYSCTKQDAMSGYQVFLCDIPDWALEEYHKMLNS